MSIVTTITTAATAIIVAFLVIAFFVNKKMNMIVNKCLKNFILSKKEP